MNLQNDPQWNLDHLQTIDRKYRTLCLSLRHYDSQLKHSYQQASFGSIQHFLKLLESTCLDYDLVLLEVTTDLDCMRLEKMAEAIEVIFGSMKKNLGLLEKQIATPYQNIGVKYVERNLCLHCERNIEEIKLQAMLPHTTLTKESIYTERKEKKEQRKEKQKEMENFMGVDREEFIRRIEQILDEKAITLSKRPAETEETLRYFLQHFKERIDTGNDNKEKQNILKVMEDIRKEENIDLLDQVTVRLRKDLIHNLKQPILNYVGKLSVCKAERMLVESKSALCEEETQTEETNTSETIRKFESRIKTITSELDIRRERTKELEKELLSHLLENSSHTQQIAQAKVRYSILEELSKQMAQEKFQMQERFQEERRLRAKEYEGAIETLKEEVQTFKKWTIEAQDEGDRLRQENYKLDLKDRERRDNAQSRECQTVGPKMSTEATQTSQRLKTAKSVLPRFLQLDQISEQDNEEIKILIEAPSNNVPKEMSEGIENHPPLQAASNHLRTQRRNTDHLLHMAKVLSLKIEPTIAHLGVSLQVRAKQARRANVTSSILKKVSKISHHRTNQSQILWKADSRHQTQYTYSSDKIKRENVVISPFVCPIVEESPNKGRSKMVKPDDPTNNPINLKSMKHPLRLRQLKNVIEAEENFSLSEERKEAEDLLGQVVAEEEELADMDKVEVLKEFSKKFRRFENNPSDTNIPQQMARDMKTLKLISRKMYTQERLSKKNPEKSAESVRKRDFYIDSRGQKVKIKDKVNEVKNVLTHEFEFLNRIGFIDILSKLSIRSQNSDTQKRTLNLFLNLPNPSRQNKEDTVVFTAKDFVLFGGYQNALKYQTGRGLWSAELHTQNFIAQVNPVVAFIESLSNPESLIQVSNFVVYPVRLVIAQKSDSKINSNHLRVCLNIVYNYHHSFCANCLHIKDFLVKIGYLESE